MERGDRRLKDGGCLFHIDIRVRGRHDATSLPSTHTTHKPFFGLGVCQIGTFAQAVKLMASAGSLLVFYAHIVHGLDINRSSLNLTPKST